MFTISAVLFAIAALGGLTLAALHFRAHGKTLPPTSLAMLHGLLAVAGVIFLIIGIAAAANGFSAGLKSMPVLALVLFVLAQAGSAYPASGSARLASALNGACPRGSASATATTRPMRARQASAAASHAPGSR